MHSHALKPKQSASERKGAGAGMKESQPVQRSAAVGSRAASSFRPNAPAASAGAQAPVQRSVAAGVVQRIPVGFVPTATFGTPYGGLNDPANSRSGDEPFTKAQRNAIYNDNIANRGARPARPVHNGPVSDVSGNQLLQRSEATSLTPEIDHIVPRANEGANDVANGRVLSKRENNQVFGIPRPTAAQRRLAVYESIDVKHGPYGGNWSADDGDHLNLNQVGDLLTYANNGNKPASWAATTDQVARTIKARASGSTRNGVKVK